MPTKRKKHPKKNKTSPSHLPVSRINNTQKSPLLMVAIGASAGGLEAIQQFFKHFLVRGNMAFFIITHLDPNRATILPEILQRSTQMEVLLMQDNAKVEAQKVYVLPPKINATISKGTLILTEQHLGDNHLPIDSFLRSLAIDQGNKAVCVILSGAGNDGTAGLRAIRDKGGLVIAQVAKSARYDSMPKSAINTGLVDYILSPEKISEYLIKYLDYLNDEKVILKNKISDDVQQVLNLLRSFTGHDFTAYKPNTIFRRIQKRMYIQHIDNISSYISYLHKHPFEMETLFKELLINVTSFFRDPEAYEVLKNELLRILKDKPKDYCFRIWVPGCSTGEEVYSIAILLQECMDIQNRYYNVQIFGTDIDDDAIEFARTGIYSTNIASDFSEEILKRYFTKEDNMYKINKDIRKMIIFATQNVIEDPPFTKLDLLSCRNLLIYLNSQLQKKLLPMFHYSLRSGGLLFLGSSETIGNAVELFNTLDRKWKLFERKDGNFSFQAVMGFPSTPTSAESTNIEKAERNMPTNEPKLSSLIEKILLDNYTPACVFIDEKCNIVYVHGKTGAYLEFASGEARLNIIEMARSDLRTKLASAIRKANLQNKEITYAGLQIKEASEYKYINLRVKPVIGGDLNRRLLLIIFEEMPSFEQIETLDGKRVTKLELDKRVSQLDQELKYTKESLQTTIEELETSNEELKSSNEELQSTNEELQSTNEEIETSKEELQSLNEELTTVNAELESRIDQLSSANDDIKNLLDNTEIATIFLDKELCVKRFTPKATNIVHLIATDVGRPVNHIVSNLKYETLFDDAKTVLKTLESTTKEVQDKDNNWHLVRIIPYRTVTNIIDGVVITFLNIHEKKYVEEKLATLAEELQSFENSNKALLTYIREPLAILKGSKIIVANAEFCKLCNRSSEEIFNQPISDFITNIPDDAMQIIENSQNQNGPVSIDKQCRISLHNKKMALNIRKISSIHTLAYITDGASIHNETHHNK